MSGSFSHSISRLAPWLVSCSPLPPACLPLGASLPLGAAIASLSVISRKAQVSRSALVSCSSATSSETEPVFIPPRYVFIPPDLGVSQRACPESVDMVCN
ncbi:hypothetical protein GUJ93_ZPchr0008g13776 [Zizania palustris]|uniref:Uncharacterized protein n=1 Tax=Zizania palustris TaxID=103762 RepID=A0A8J5QZH0_ZIZPA|nr:hypothetical protein GUJ93_ZPchr0008g13776 [Zizania palustris]